jgi:hypothetical protein
MGTYAMALLLAVGCAMLVVNETRIKVVDTLYIRNLFFD